MTDVNIAIEMLSDTFEDLYDTALLISADSDLSGAIKKIKKLFPNKRIVVAFPPDRFSFTLKQLANASFIIGRKKLADSVFPNKVIKETGFILKKPDKWK